MTDAEHERWQAQDPGLGESYTAARPQPLDPFWDAHFRYVMGGTPDPLADLDVAELLALIQTRVPEFTAATVREAVRGFMLVHNTSPDEAIERLSAGIRVDLTRPLPPSSSISHEIPPGES